MGINTSKILLSFCLFLASCSSKELTVNEYYKWASDTDNGLVKVENIGDLEISAKYISPQILAIREIKLNNTLKNKMDSIVKQYNGNLNFVVTLGPKQEATKKFDITSVGIENYADFDERLKFLTFEMKNLFTLKSGARSWSATICEMENVFGLTYSRKFNLVFSPTQNINELQRLKKFKVEFDDKLFGSGRTNFTFSRKDIDNSPKIIF